MMHMIMFVLHDTGKLAEILEAWENAGVKGITIIPSTGVGRLKAADLLREDLPLMPSLEDLVEAPEKFNRTLITMIKCDEMIEKVVTATESVVGKLDDPNTGILVVVPLSHAYGLDRDDS
jgi:nitrogen regulatory protein PII